MNPFEMIRSLLMGSPAVAADGPGRFAEPDLAPPSPPSSREPIFQSEGDNSPAMLLRRALTGSSASPGLLSEPPRPVRNPPPPAPTDGPPPQMDRDQPSMPSNVALGSMPAPASEQDKLRAMFTQGQQQPAAAPMQRPPLAPRAPSAPMSAPSGGTAAPAAPVPAAAPPGGGGLTDFLAGLQKNPTANLLRDLLTSSMAGAATAQGPRAGGIGALGVGYTTAEQQMRAREKERAAGELAKQKLSFDQTMTTRKDTREERGANRADEELGIKRSDQKRKAEESKVRNQVSVEKLMKIRDDGTLPLAAKIKIQDQLNQYADKVNKNGLMTQNELDSALTKERDRLEQYYGLKKPAGQQGGAAPVTRQARGPDGKVVTFMLENGQWVPQK